MIGILGGMGTQAGLDFCNKLAILNRGKIDQEYPLFLLYNKANIPGRPESIGVHTRNLLNRFVNTKSKKKYNLVLKSLLKGCELLKESKCKFIVIPCNTAHYWYDDLKKKINLPIINMPREVFNHTIKRCKKNIEIGNIIKKEINEFSKKNIERNQKEKISILVLGGSQAAKVFAETLPTIFKKCSSLGIPLKIYQHCFF